MKTARTAGAAMSWVYVLVLTFFLPAGTVFLGNTLVATAHFSSAAVAKVPEIPASNSVPDEVSSLMVACPDEDPAEKVL